MRGERIGPRPKALPQASKNGVYERAVGVVGEEGLKNVDVYWGIDIEKVCVGSDGVICNSSELGGLGRGIAVLDHSAVVMGFWLSAPHKLYRRYLG